MANKNYFGGKKALSKRAAELLEEINQSKSVQTVKETGQALSKRAAELLEEINQSKSVQTVKEISDFIGVFLGDKKTDDISTEIKTKKELPDAKKKRTSKKKVKPPNTGTSRFNSTHYRNLSSSNKLYLWGVEILITVSLFLFLLIKAISQANTNIDDQKIYTETVSRIASINNDIEMSRKQAIFVKNESTKLESTLDALRSQFFPTLKEVQNYSDDITRLFELSNLVIVKQNIKSSDQYNKNIDQDPPIYSIPKAEESTLSVAGATSNAATPAATPAGKNAPVAAPAAAPAAAEEKTKNPPSPPLPPPPPKNISFISYDLTLRGNYLNYLKARNALTRVLPSVNIPYEDIAKQKGKENMEFRIIIEIPYRFK